MPKGCVIALWAGIAAIGLGYLLQLPTPLRMNTDGVIYLTLAASLHDGGGYTWHGHRPHFPPGYPVIVATLERVGLASSFGLVALNLICFGVSLLCGAWLLRRWLGFSQAAAGLSVLIVLLGFATVRYAAIPGSEMPYMAVSFLCLVLLWMAENEKGNIAWGYLFVAWALMPVAMSIRLVGVTLQPAVLWSILIAIWKRRRAPQPTFAQWAGARKQQLMILALASFVIVCAAAWGVSRTSYFREGAALMEGNGVVSEMVFTLKQRCIEVGDIFTNLRGDRFAHLGVMLECWGIVFLLAIVFLLLRRLRNPTCIDVYLLAYVCILLVWPYRADVRFWLPVELLVVGLVLQEFLRWTSDRAIGRYVKTAGIAWLIVFTFFGAGALIWSWRLTYSGSQFSERYDLPMYRDTYRAALHNGLPVEAEKVNTELLPLLKRYGARDFR